MIKGKQSVFLFHQILFIFPDFSIIFAFFGKTLIFLVLSYSNNVFSLMFVWPAYVQVIIETWHPAMWIS